VAGQVQTSAILHPSTAPQLHLSNQQHPAQANQPTAPRDNEHEGLISLPVFRAPAGNARRRRWTQPNVPRCSRRHFQPLMPHRPALCSQRCCSTLDSSGALSSIHSYEIARPFHPVFFTFLFCSSFQAPYPSIPRESRPTDIRRPLTPQLRLASFSRRTANTTIRYVRSALESCRCPIRFFCTPSSSPRNELGPSS